MIKFAAGRVSDEWALSAGSKLFPTLRAITNQVAAYLFRMWGQDTIITCIYRTVDEDKALYHDPTHEPGVHCYWRGVDVSVKNLSSHEALGVVAYVNAQWDYDPSRPNLQCALYETAQDFGSSAPHIHLQCHENTVIVEQSDVPVPDIQA